MKSSGYFRGLILALPLLFFSGCKNKSDSSNVKKSGNSTQLDSSRPNDYVKNFSYSKKMKGSNVFLEVFGSGGKKIPGMLDVICNAKMRGNQPTPNSNHGFYLIPTSYRNYPGKIGAEPPANFRTQNPYPDSDPEQVELHFRLNFISTFLTETLFEEFVHTNNKAVRSENRYPSFQGYVRFTLGSESYWTQFGTYGKFGLKLDIPMKKTDKDDTVLVPKSMTESEIKKIAKLQNIKKRPIFKIIGSKKGISENKKTTGRLTYFGYQSITLPDFLIGAQNHTLEVLPERLLSSSEPLVGRYSVLVRPINGNVTGKENDRKFSNMKLRLSQHQFTREQRELNCGRFHLPSELTVEFRNTSKGQTREPYDSNIEFQYTCDISEAELDLLRKAIHKWYVDSATNAEKLTVEKKTTGSLSNCQ